jgi:hypothetical protein
MGSHSGHQKLRAKGILLDSHNPTTSHELIYRMSVGSQTRHRSEILLCWQLYLQLS